MEIFQQIMVQNDWIRYFWILMYVILLDRKKGAEINGVDFNVPEYLLPNQKDVLLTPLFTVNSKNRV
jgi:hypothetical protein